MKIYIFLRVKIKILCYKNYFPISCKICSNPYIYFPNVKGNFIFDENSDLLAIGNIKINVDS